MTILKKRKKIIPVLCVVFAVLIAILTFGLLFPKKNTTAKADASFAQAGFPNVRLSIEAIYYDTSRNITLNYSPIPSEYNVTNGFNLSLILKDAGILYDLENLLIDNIYVALFFDTLPFDSSQYDLYFSEAKGIFTSINNSHAFEYKTNNVLDLEYEEFLPPLSALKSYRAILPSDGWTSVGRQVSSFVFALNLNFFREMARPYLLGYLDYCMFIYDKKAFVNYNVAYQQGYEGGYEYGYETGYEEGNAYGDRIGYNRGYSKGLSESNTFTGLLSAVFDVPVQTFFGLLNFEILGVNLSSFILAFFTISLFIFLIRRFIS